MSSSASYAPRLLPLRLPRVCVAVVGRTPAEMLERAEGVVRDNPFVEFRLDYLREPSAGFARIKRFLDYHPEVLAIATCRRARNGGKFQGSVASEIELLIRAAAAGCQLLDLELESVLKLKPKDVERLRTHAALILSFHDFRATRKLDETFKKMQAVPADLYKLVSTANRLYDNVVRMSSWSRRARSTPWWACA
jgi:3-dehydroquinate dehydratase/shikimate dehydrogenase